MDPSAALAFMGMPSGMEWLVVLIIALLLFGRRLPEVMRGMGGGVREFRRGLEGEGDESTHERRDQAVPRVESSPQSPPTGEYQQQGEEQRRER